MPVIEAQCASILVPHDHRHINHDRASAAAPIIQICARRGLCSHAPVGMQNGGYRAAAVASDRDAVLQLFRRQSSWLLICGRQGWSYSEVGSDVVVEPRRGPHCGADSRPPIMRSARRDGTYPVLGGRGWLEAARWARGCYGCRVEGAGWEFLVEHVAGTTGMTGLRGPDDEDMGTGRPISESDGP
jgi:hypothetical protein